MNPSHSVWTFGVVAVSSAAILAFMTSNLTSLYMPTSTAVQSGVSSLVPVTRVSDLRKAGTIAVAAGTAGSMEVQESLPTSFTSMSPVSILTIPVISAAIFYALGRWMSRSEEKVGLMDIAIASTTGESLSRRAALQTSVATAASLVAMPSLAAGIPAGFTFHKDPYDGYEFLYPFGWQELSVQGQDVLYKDVIEPLETIGVTVTETSKTAISEFGDVQTVCMTFADKFLTNPDQNVTLLDAQSEESDGILYYTMEFLASSPNYTRHALAALAICNGKLYTCLTGSNERRWKKVEERLRTAIDSFTVFKVSRVTK